MSAIQWTEKTWNPVVGCSIVSTECKNCYAMQMAHRIQAMGQTDKFDGTTEIRNDRPIWNGVVRLHRPSLDIPHDTKKPTLWFVDSMSDLFHESMPYEDIISVWSVMTVVDRHRYQVLTKRSERMRDVVNGWIDHMRAGTKRPVENIWLGTSVGYKPAKERINALRETNAAIRFLSCEPLLEDLGELDLSGIHWVIVGGESGPGARPCDIRWIENIVRQCREQNVAVFVKQMGKLVVDSQYAFGTFAPWDKRSLQAAEDLKLEHIGFNLIVLKDHKGGEMAEWPAHLRIREYPTAVLAP